ncbi:hypothetical protein [uncultured Corynebacterium sp.]
MPFDLVVDLRSGRSALDPGEIEEMYPFIQASDVQRAMDFNSAVEEWAA